MDQGKIWDYYQTEATEAFSRTGPRFRFLTKQIAPRERVLNIGVGDGSLESLLSLKGTEVWSLDPSEKAIQRMKASLGDRARVGYSQSMPFAEGSFDTVVMTEVLEHLENDVRLATLSEIKRVLVASGRFVGTVPADEVLEENRAVCPHCGQVFHRYGHAVAFSRESLHAELSRQFRSVNIERRYFCDFSSLNWKGRLGATVKTGMVSLGVKGSNENFYFSASNST